MRRAPLFVLRRGSPLEEIGHSMRTLVVGASSGLGRCIGIALASRGDQVALLARRKDRLESAVAESGGNAIAVACDVTDEKACAAAVEEAATVLGGIDAVVYAPGVGPLRPIADVGAETWRQVLDTNVIGASTVTAAALPHLQTSLGVAVYLTSVNGSLTTPWPGLATYAVSKAALNTLVDAWRSEHPQLGFTRIYVGECIGGDGDASSEFANSWDPALAGELMGGWIARGQMSGGLMDGSAVVHAVTTAIDSGARIPSLTVVPRIPAAS